MATQIFKKIGISHVGKLGNLTITGFFPAWVFSCGSWKNPEQINFQALAI